MEGGDETTGRVGEELVREACKDFLPPSRKFKLKLQFLWYLFCFSTSGNEVIFYVDNL